MLVLLIYFLLTSLVIIAGFVSPTVREYKISNLGYQSRQSYFLSESGSEDAIYRVKRGKSIGSNEMISLNGGTVSTDIITTSSTRELTSTSSIAGIERKVFTVFSAGVGADFSYGVQVGQGGFDINGGSTLNGNIYANGPITGDSSSSITGSAISGNSSALVLDQYNPFTPSTPEFDIAFGNTAATQDVAQSFQLASSAPLNKVQLYIKKTSTPSDATVKIVSDASGVPGTTVLASGTLSASSVTTSYNWVEVAFTTNPTLATGTTYWFVIDVGSTSATRYYLIGTNNAAQVGYGRGVGKIGQLSGSWNNTTPSGLDYFFKLYVGGIMGIVAGSSGSQWNPLHIGTISGIAQANTVNYVNSTGLIYCQNGTGNNKSCTSGTDPSYISFPVADDQINTWKSDAEAGGVYTGNYTISAGTVTLGPLKIVGNLTVNSGGTLIMSGVIWVTGTITLSGGSTISLSSSYGTNEGVVIADGIVTIGSGADATGSGVSGSYLMIATTSYASNALTISGGSGAVILYAPNGTMNISGGAHLKEAVAYRISISGGSSVDYDTGLINTNFSSGPSGGWNVQRWQEVQ